MRTLQRHFKERYGVTPSEYRARNGYGFAPPGGGRSIAASGGDGPRVAPGLEQPELAGDRCERGVGAAAVAQGLDQVLLTDLVSRFEVGDRARDPQHAVPGAGGQA